MPVVEANAPCGVGAGQGFSHIAKVADRGLQLLQRRIVLSE